jgi:hypothetical protein
VLDDATVGILTEITTTAGTAIGKVLDAAVMFGTAKPASWVSAGLTPAALAASQTASVTTGAANAADIVGAANRAAKLLAKNGFVADTMITSLSLRYDVENIPRGAPIFRGETCGFNTVYNRNGAWDTLATAIVLDPHQDRCAAGHHREVLGSGHGRRSTWLSGTWWPGSKPGMPTSWVSRLTLGYGEVPVATVIGGGS